MPIDAGHVNALGTERISKLIIRYSMPTMLSRASANRKSEKLSNPRRREKRETVAIEWRLR